MARTGQSPILEQFERVLGERPYRVACRALTENRCLTFADLAEEYRIVREVLEKARLTEGSCLVSLAGNKAVSLAIILACLDVGIVLLPLDGGTPIAEAMAVIERYRAAAMIGEEGNRISGVETVFELPDGLSLFGLRRRDADLELEDTAVLKLTSGSDGAPKAVCSSEMNLWNDGRHIIEAMGIEPDDVNFGAIPISHSYGLGNLVMPLLLQGTAVVLRDSVVPAYFFQDMSRWGVTVVPGVPFMLEHIYRQAQGKRLPTSLRLLLSAGAPMDPGTVSSFKKRFGLKIHSFYGSSETGGITYDDGEEVGDPLSLGKPMPETTVSLDRLEDSATEGRIRVNGNAVARKYAPGGCGGDSPELTDGEYLTGDVGRFDERGRLFLTGRISSFVNVAGRKVNPAETEKVLLEMPEISAVKVLGLSCEKRGQKLLACLVPAVDGLSTVTIRTYCAARLSPHKIPRELIFVETIPVDGRGKTDRRALEELARSTPSKS